MTSSGSQHGSSPWKWTLAALVVVFALGASLAGADATGGNAKMSGRVNGGDGGVCASASGKALYDCLANKLDTKADRLSGGAEVEPVRTALHTAATQLRSATSKAQALSAISQCRSVVLGVLAKVRATGSGGALETIAGVLSRAAQLIQSKG